MPRTSIVLPECRTTCRSFVDVLRSRASDTPSREAFVFLEDGTSPGSAITYAELDARARAIAATLARTVRPGDRALLVYPAGLDFIAAFFGCLYAGVIAVPAYPPVPSRLGRTLPRFQTIVADARATLVLTTASFAEFAAMLPPVAPELASLHWLPTDTIPLDEAKAWIEVPIESHAPAFLQYTSGSTGVPKGVMISHWNLLHNANAHYVAAKYSTKSVHVSWLPVYHDMGLINGILQPVFACMFAVVMPPMAFLKRPFVWLDAITRYRGTASQFPNFALDLCVRKISEEERRGLDLSSWVFAMNGAEPIRAESLDRFTEAFAPCGFRREALSPGYGLAEATVFVSVGAVEAPPRVLHLNQSELEQHRVVLDASAGPLSKAVVAVGRTIPDQPLRIVDPVSLRPLGPCELGEVWVSGPGIALGYWGRDDETQATFRAQIEGEPGTFYLRTGDLGFLHEGELYLTGRQKDLIIVRGRNLYPQDLEQATEKAHAAIRPGGVAAFAIDHDGQEAAVIVAELDSEMPRASALVIARAVRRHVSETCDVAVHSVVLLKPGALPKTSSGKVQRRPCRKAYLEGTLDVLCESSLPLEHAPRASESERPPPPPMGAIVNALRAQRDSLTAYVREQVAAVLRVPQAEIATDSRLADFGADSVQLMDLSAAFERDLKVVLPVELLTWDPTVGELVSSLLKVLVLQ